MELILLQLFPVCKESNYFGKNEVGEVIGRVPDELKFRNSAIAERQVARSLGRLQRDGRHAQVLGRFHPCLEDRPDLEILPDIDAPDGPAGAGRRSP
jgi:hypothetical protein